MAQLLSEATWSRFDLAAQIAEVRREIGHRQALYPRWVAEGRLKQEVAETRLRTLEKVLETLMNSAGVRNRGWHSPRVKRVVITDPGPLGLGNAEQDIRRAVSEAGEEAGYDLGGHLGTLFSGDASWPVDEVAWEREIALPDGERVVFGATLTRGDAATAGGRRP